LSAEDAGHHFGMFTFEISLCIMFKWWNSFNAHFNF
jgi:hypothetical protein